MVPRAHFVEESRQSDSDSDKSNHKSELTTSFIDNSIYNSTNGSGLNSNEFITSQFSTNSNHTTLTVSDNNNSYNSSSGEELKMTLLPKRKRRSKVKDEDVQQNTVVPESSLTIALQITFPFLMAGMGMVAAGLVLDKVQVRCL